MLHLEFTAADIARTRGVGTLGPFAETVLGVTSLRMDRPNRVAAPWSSVLSGPLGPAVRDLGEALAPRSTWQVDLFSSTDGAPAPTFDDGARAWMDIPQESLVREIRAARCHTAPAATWLGGLERADAAPRRLVSDLLRRLHDDLIQPRWPKVRARLDAERARLQDLVLTGGVEALLSSLHPMATWNAPFLSLPAGGRWQSEPFHASLGGRGLHIVPSMYCPVGPVPFFPAEGPGLLLCPVRPRPTGAEGDGRSGAESDALARVLGRTRAAVLASIADGCTTGQIAARLDISAASASEHASAMRAAGLVRSTRDRNRVRHDLTPLGTDLLTRSGARI